MIGALIHTMLAAALAGIAIVGVHLLGSPSMLFAAGVAVTFFPALFFGREMRDSQRERQTHGNGHRNKLHIVDLVPGFSPFRIGTMLDWIGPVAVWIGTIIYILVA